MRIKDDGIMQNIALGAGPVPAQKLSRNLYDTKFLLSANIFVSDAV